MQATVTEAKNWKDGTSYPILLVFATGEEHKEELEALQMIEESVNAIIGKAYGGKIASTQKGSGQRGIFCVDMSAVLTMLKAVEQSAEKKKAAGAWIHNWLKDKIKPAWLPSKKAEEEFYKIYTCRCGREFPVKSERSKKKIKRKYLAHQKRCTVLKELEQSVFKRGKAYLEREEKEDGSQRKRSKHTPKTGKASRSRSGKATKEKASIRGTKTGRVKRDHHSKPRKV